MQRVKAMLFDVDGVLVTGKPFSHALEERYGITRAMTAPFFNGIFFACLIGRADLKQEVASYLQEWGWQGTVNEFVDTWFEYEHNINASLLEIVRQLREQSILCYLATNQEKYRTDYILNRMGFGGQFDGIFSSAHVGYTKPDRNFFEAVLQSLQGIAPEEIFFWDDNAGYVAAAREANLQAEVYRTFDEFAATMCRYFSLDVQ